MEYSTLYTLLSLGFGLGMLHALDADHIMAVSSMASAKADSEFSRSRRAIVRNMIWFCIRWAAGHGATILAISFLFIFTHAELPQIVPDIAEKLIGILLIGIGLWILFSLYNNRIKLEVHTHNEHHHDTVTHVHLTESGKMKHSHQPVLVGMTHGIAGSAPVLALIPATEYASAYLGMIYVFLFCMGVLISMALFGIFFAELQTWLTRASQKLFQFSRGIIASISIGFGTYWLFQ